VLLIIIERVHKASQIHPQIDCINEARVNRREKLTPTKKEASTSGCGGARDVLRTLKRSSTSSRSGTWPELASGPNPRLGQGGGVRTKSACRSGVGGQWRVRRTGGGARWCARARRWPEAARTAAHDADGGGGDNKVRSEKNTVANRYDRRDPRISVASDEPTA
jgi:hypothetical protein